MAPLIALALKLAPIAGAIVPEVVRAIGGSQAATTAEKVISIAEAATGLKKDDAVSAIQRDPALALEFQRLIFADRQEFRRLDVEERKAYLADTQSARATHAGDRGVFWLGIAILVTYAGILATALAGAYWLLIEGWLPEMDAGTVAAVFAMIGTIMGYIASDAKQVVSYYFGSSRGSQDKTNALGDAVKNLRPE